MSYKFCLTVCFEDLPGPIWGGGGGRSRNFSQVPEPICGGVVSVEFFQVLEPIYGCQPTCRGGELRYFLSPKAYIGKSLEFLQVSEPIWECQIQYIDIFLHIFHTFLHIYCIEEFRYVMS